MSLPECLDCKYAALGFPCRTSAGTFDFGKVGTGYILHGRSYSVDGENLDSEAREAHAWASDCAFEIEEEHPGLLLRLIPAAADACETPADAGYLAAGLIENAVLKHGPLLIEKIEALARASPKFRFLLSGVWSQSGSVESDVWARVGKAVGSSPRMSNDGRSPHDGSKVTVLGDDEVVALLRERVTPVAERLML